MILGVQGNTNEEILKHKIPQMQFSAFSGWDFAEEILLLRVTYAFFDLFLTRAALQAIGEAEPSPPPPPCLCH